MSADVDASQCATAYDALKEACEEAGVALAVSGSGSAVYVKGIGSYKEQDQGPGSGWLYFVNGTSPSKSCGACEVAAGDTVRFAYTTDFGKDLQ